MLKHLIRMLKDERGLMFAGPARTEEERRRRGRITRRWMGLDRAGPEYTRERVDAGLYRPISEYQFRTKPWGLRPPRRNRWFDKFRGGSRNIDDFTALNEGDRVNIQNMVDSGASDADINRYLREDTASTRRWGDAGRGGRSGHEGYPNKAYKLKLKRFGGFGKMPDLANLLMGLRGMRGLRQRGRFGFGPPRRMRWMGRRMGPMIPSIRRWPTFGQGGPMMGGWPAPNLQNRTPSAPSLLNQGGFQTGPAMGGGRMTPFTPKMQRPRRKLHWGERDPNWDPAWGPQPL